MKSSLVYFLLMTTLALSSCGLRNEKALLEKPNVVVIFIDDMGYADPSCFGNPFVKTPSIDKLAKNGLKFTNFYVNSPICSPSRTALMTGQYPLRHRIHSYIASSDQNRKRGMANYLSPDAPILARTLRQHGYVTGHFGKWHLGGGRDIGDVPMPTEYGYDRSLVSFEGIGDRVLFPGDGLSAQSAKLGKGKIIWAEKHRSTSIYVDSALAFIERAKKPFYVNLFPNDVHDRHLPDSLTLKKYTDVTDNPFEQKFFAVLDELDRQIGRFMDGLEKMGKLNNTIVVFTSDNGPTDWPRYYQRDQYPNGYDGELYPPGFTGPFYGRKWSLFEGGIREPFIIYWKDRIPAGKTDDTTVMAAFDLFPSICGLLDIPPPESLDGTDKSSALLGHPIKMSQPIMWEYGSSIGGSIRAGNPDFVSPSLAIRDGRWKLLVNADSTDIHLYDLKMDPGEAKNLAEGYPKVASRLAHSVLSWRRSLPVQIARLD